MKRKSPKHRTTEGSKASSDEMTSAPNRKNRPSVEELGGTSEYQVQAATDLDEDGGDPLESVLEDRPEGGQDLFEPVMTVGEHHGGPPVEELVVDPDELGVHFLRGAVQEPGVEQEEPELDIRTESELLTSGRTRQRSRRVANQRKLTQRGHAR